MNEYNFFAMETNFLPSGNILFHIRQIYKRAGMVEKARALSSDKNKIFLSDALLLIGDYGKHDNPDKAFDVLISVLRSSLEPTLELFNETLNAWALSSKPYAFEQALETIKIMENNQKCRGLCVKPNIYSYEALLKCLYNNAEVVEEAGEKAESILKEMQEREMIYPSETILSLAINCCLAGRDFKRADALRIRCEYGD